MVKTEQSELFDLNKPLAFADGSSVYKKFAKEYVTHKMGFFIMAPSGAGKTHYIVSQKKKHWIDGDDLWKATHAHPKDGWWLEPLDVIEEIDKRCDVITAQAKRLGFWIMGASNNWLKPDAIVIPHWSTHKKWIRCRETHHYDGGATSDKLGQVMSHRQWIMQWMKKGVPKFKTVDDAVDYLVKKYKARK